ncbi:hypothetical protein HK101_009949 [Irineochytrium annulatum]|nr:hypothetical protein HK101_009949 [Irineochytrium annulatum]
MPKGKPGPKRQPIKEHLSICPDRTFLSEEDVLPYRVMPPLHPKVRPLATDFEYVTESDAVPYVPLTRGRTFTFKAKGQPDETKFVDAFQAIDQRTPKGASLSIVDAFVSDCYKDNRGRFILNAGGSVWGLDWANGIENGNQYLAVAGYRGNAEEHNVLGVRQTEPDQLRGYIQIWGAGAAVTDGHESEESKEVPTLEMMLLHDYGCVYDLRWAPWGAYESVEHFKKDDAAPPDALPRLGLLAVCFGDGTMRVLNIPHPSALRQKVRVPPNACLTVRIRKNLFRAQHPQSLLHRVAWGSFDCLATGGIDGNITVWSLKDALLGITHEEPLRKSPADMDIDVDVGVDNSRALQRMHLKPAPIYTVPIPIVTFRAHDSSVRDVRWSDSTLVRIEDGVPPKPPTDILSCGSDGRFVVHDLRDPWTRLQIYRARAIIQSIAWAPAANGLVFTDSDNGVRFMRPGEDDVYKTPTVKDDEDSWRQRSYGVASHPACAWHIDTSAFIPFVVSVGADGSVKMSNLNRAGQRTQKACMQTLYKLEIHDGNVLRLTEDIELELLQDVAMKGDPPTAFFPLDVAIQKVVFNRSRQCASWIATGGVYGFVRVESVYFRKQPEMPAKKVKQKLDKEEKAKEKAEKAEKPKGKPAKVPRQRKKKAGDDYEVEDMDDD